MCKFCRLCKMCTCCNRNQKLQIIGKLFWRKRQIDFNQRGPQQITITCLAPLGAVCSLFHTHLWHPELHQWCCVRYRVTVALGWLKTLKRRSQLFEKGSIRKKKTSDFGAFNIQWTLVTNCNPSLNYLLTFDFLTSKCQSGVKVDAAGNNFLGSLDTLEMLENSYRLNKCGF